MREVLFRGKNVDGKWVEGYFVKGKSYGGKGECYIMRNVTSFPFNDYYYDEVDPETISEFTGLTDKNGKRIFEGNLLKITSTVFDGIIQQLCTREDIALVEYDSKTSGYRLKVYNNGEYKRISKFSINHLCAYNAEVIGNKWDNPELLEKGVD